MARVEIVHSNLERECKEVRLSTAFLLQTRLLSTSQYNQDNQYVNNNNK